MNTLNTPFDRPLNLKPCCLDLRHKMMYVDPRQMTPGMVDDGSDTRVFLCMKTQNAIGPDDGPVSPAACNSEGRGCFHGHGSRPVVPTIRGMQSGESA
jgi:hypothetical protein